MTGGHPAGSWGPEVRRVAAAAAGALGRLPYARAGGSVERALARGSIVVLGPFFFAEALPFDGALGAARTLSLANAFGAAHFLAQDRVLDGDESPSPEESRFSDLALSLFMRENGRLFHADHRFWPLLDRHLDEYFESLTWERAVLRTPLGSGAVAPDALDDTLRRLGQRMSPLKACAAGIALLSGRDETLGLMEEIIEDYHAAFQLADDLADFQDDLAKGRWSVAHRLIAVRAGLELGTASGGEADAADLMTLGVTCGALGELVGLISDRYDRARAGAVSLRASSLAEHIARTAEETVSLLRWRARRASAVVRAAVGAAAARRPRPEEPASELHAFRVHGRGYVFDPSTSLFFHADHVALDVLAEVERGSSPSGLDVLRMNHGRDAVDEVLAEAAAVADVPGNGGRVTAAPGALTALALHVTERCNLSCDYCYLGAGDRGCSMSEDVALRALDVLFDESFGAPRLSVVFFGGEPLLGLDLVERVATVARERASAEGRQIALHLTTNGTLLTRGAAARLAALGIGVLVSIDGDRAGHDAHRRHADGSGSYDAVAWNLAGLPGGFKAGARATVTAESPPLPDLVRHLSGLGLASVHLSPVSSTPMQQSFATRLCSEFERVAAAELELVGAGKPPVVGNLVEAVLALERGAERRLPCGAGARYVSAAPDGTLYLCHRFAGDPSSAVGDVVNGFDRTAARRVLEGFAARAAACLRCWARPLCGGPCYHDLARSSADAVGPTAPRCRVRRRVFELSMWLYASLPDRARRKLAEAAVRVVRPEIGVAGGEQAPHGLPSDHERR